MRYRLSRGDSLFQKSDQSVKLIDTYNYPTSTRANIGGLRHYDINGEAQKLPSVTTVIAQTKDKKDNIE